MKSRRARALATCLLLTACGGKILTTQTNDETLVVGNACTDDSDCSPKSGDAALACFTSNYGESLPNGYCTEHCASVADCFGPPTAIGCGKLRLDSDDRYPPYCFAACDPNADATQCRPGYQCLPFVSTEGKSTFGCWVVGG